MKNLSSFQNFLIKEDIKWIDSYILNESKSRDNILSFLRKTFKKMKGMTSDRKKTLLIYALSSLLVFTNSKEIYNLIKSDPEICEEITPEIEDVIEEKLKEEIFFDPVNMRLSKQGWKNIKMIEGDHKGEPLLTAYDIDDNRITIGWGHAEKKETSKYKLGQKITREEAKKLLESDLKIAADGVRRIFKQWKEEGIERKLTQDQFDALVSMAFNMGVAGLRRTETLKYIKEGDYKKAGEMIKVEGISDKFEKGHTKRRSDESEMFLSYLST
jgi:lysozyme